MLQTCVRKAVLGVSAGTIAAEHEVDLREVKVCVEGLCFIRDASDGRVHKRPGIASCFPAPEQLGYKIMSYPQLWCLLGKHGK